MATKTTQKKQGVEGKSELPFAAGLVAGIAGAYFLYGKNATAHRKKVKGWIIKAKGEAIEKIEKMKEMDETSYHALVESVTQKYAKVKGIEQAEVDELVQDLKKHWKNIAKDTAPQKKKAKKKSVKKVTE